MAHDLPPFYTPADMTGITRAEVYRRLVSGQLIHGPGWLRPQIDLLQSNFPLMQTLGKENSHFELNLITDYVADNYPIPVHRKDVQTAVYSIKAEISRLETNQGRTFLQQMIVKRRERLTHIQQSKRHAQLYE